MHQILLAAKRVLRDAGYRTGFLLGIPSVFFLLVSIPVLAIPYNSVGFQLKIFSARDWFLLIVLSVLFSLAAVMQVRSIALNRIARQRTDVVRNGIFGAAGTAIASIFGAASCASCVAAILGFLGFGTVLFLLQFRWMITIAAIGLMLVSLYFTSRKLNGLCTACDVA